MDSIKESLAKIAGREVESKLPAVTGSDNGKVLTVVEGAWNKAAAQGGGGSAEPLIVDFSDGDETDKTAGEIYAAFIAGQIVVLQKINEGTECNEVLVKITKSELMYEAEFASTSLIADGADGTFHYAD